jgi:hypothetical protein
VSIIPLRGRRLNPDGPWKCSKCGQYKVPSEFSSDVNNPFGKSYYCFACERERGVGKRAKARERGYKRPALTETQQEHERWQQRKRMYGITKEEVLAMIDGQGGCCPICLRTLRVTGKRCYYIDHCHDTGRVRGIVCPLCNSFLARIGDRTEDVERLLKYINGNN